MPEGRFQSKYHIGRENQLEDALNAKMMKILSKMENIKETVKAEKQKLIFSDHKSKINMKTSEFIRKNQKNSNKKDNVNYTKKNKKSTFLNQVSNDFMPSNLTFSGPQKLKNLRQLSNQNENLELKKLDHNFQEEKRDFKLIPMKDISIKEKTNLGLMETFKNPTKESLNLFTVDKGKNLKKNILLIIKN